MSEVDEFDAEAKLPGPQGCWAEKLTPEQKAKIADAKARGHNAATIHRVVQNRWGVKIRYNQVRKHLGGECACDG